MSHENSTTRVFLFPIILLFLLTLTIYSNSLNASWHLDDYSSIVDNTKVQISHLTPALLFQSMQHPERTSYWRPLSFLTFALNWYIGQNAVIGYHLVNILSHLLTAFLIFLSMGCLLETPVLRGKYTESTYFISLLTAVLWAANPIQVQAVTYIVQRMTVLAGLFCIAGIFCYLKARLTAKRRHCTYFLIATTVFWLLGMASKENAVILPLILVLLEIIFFKNIDEVKTHKRVLTAGVSAIVVVAGIGSVLYLNGDVMSVFAGYGDRYFTIVERTLTQPRVLVFYLTQIFFPLSARLSIDHDIEVSTSLWHPWTTMPAMIAIALLIFYALYQIKKRPLLSFAILFFFLNHLIESTFLPLELVFEHRNYLPSMFLFAPVSVGAKWLLDRHYKRRRFDYLIVSGFIILLIIGFGFGTYQRNRDWQTEVSLWSDAYRKAPRLQRTVHNLAMALYEKNGHLDKALELYQRADSLKMHRRSHRAGLYSNIANIHFRQGRYKDAEVYFEKAHAIAPQKPYFRYRLGDTLRKQKKWDRALNHVDILLRRHPRNSDYLNLKGTILLNKKNIDHALNAFRHAIIASPDQSVGYVNAGIALMALGANNRAEKLFKLGLNLEPENILTYLRLIDVNLRMQDSEEVETLLHYLIESASAEAISLSLEDISKEPNNNGDDYRKLENNVATEMAKYIPRVTRRTIK
jgi:tetratricopeptide (TPR) repeat protein